MRWRKKHNGARAISLASCISRLVHAWGDSWRHQCFHCKSCPEEKEEVMGWGHASYCLPLFFPSLVVVIHSSQVKKDGTAPSLGKPRKRLWKHSCQHMSSCSCGENLTCTLFKQALNLFLSHFCSNFKPGFLYISFLPLLSSQMFG